MTGQALWKDIYQDTVNRVLQLQEKYCQEHQVPNFLAQCPKCPRCSCEIAFFTLEREAELKHITKCCSCDFSLDE